MSKNETLKEKKIDTEEFAKELCKLTEEQRLKVYYMVKGIVLVNNPSEAMAV